jgi:hypothetical protein
MDLAPRRLPFDRAPAERIENPLQRTIEFCGTILSQTFHKKFWLEYFCGLETTPNIPPPTEIAEFRGLETDLFSVVSRKIDLQTFARACDCPIREPPSAITG